LSRLQALTERLPYCNWHFLLRGKILCLKKGLSREIEFKYFCKNG
jgi:hypothetical protein